MAPSRKASTTPWNHASLNHSTLFETGSKAGQRPVADRLVRWQGAEMLKLVHHFVEDVE